MPKKSLKKPMTAFRKKVVKEDKSSFSATESRFQRDEGGKEDKTFFDFAAAWVFKIVKRIPKGKVMAYKRVAELAGRPRAWRVVGNILNKNNDSKIPCHRVIKSNGEIGGYKNGIEKKVALLKKEGIIIKNGKVTSRLPE